MCRTPFSVLSPSVHFGVHWVGECARENQAMYNVYIKNQFQTTFAQEGGGGL